MVRAASPAKALKAVAKCGLKVLAKMSHPPLGKVMKVLVRGNRRTPKNRRLLSTNRRTMASDKTPAWATKEAPVTVVLRTTTPGLPLRNGATQNATRSHARTTRLPPRKKPRPQAPAKRNLIRVLIRAVAKAGVGSKVAGNRPNKLDETVLAARRRPTKATLARPSPAPPTPLSAQATKRKPQIRPARPAIKRATVAKVRRRPTADR